MKDLLTALELPDNNNGLGYGIGLDNFPAFTISESAVWNKKPASLFFKQDQLSKNFAITTTIKLKNRGGLLFAVVSPYGEIIQFGLEIVYKQSSYAVVLYHTPDARYARRSSVLAEFKLPSTIANRWTKIGIKSKDDVVSLFVNCESETSKSITSIPSLTFERGSTLYVASGGPTLQKKYVVSLSYINYITVFPPGI